MVQINATVAWPHTHTLRRTHQLIIRSDHSGISKFRHVYITNGLAQTISDLRNIIYEAGRVQCGNSVALQHLVALSYLYSYPMYPISHNSFSLRSSDRQCDKPSRRSYRMPMLIQCSSKAHAHPMTGISLAKYASCEMWGCINILVGPRNANYSRYAFKYVQSVCIFYVNDMKGVGV